MGHGDKKSLLQQRRRQQNQGKIGLYRRVIQPDAMSAYRVDVLVSRVERGQTVAQAAYERVQGLIGDPGSLVISPYRGNQVRSADDLSVAFVQQPEQLELLCRERWDELLLVHPYTPGLLIHEQAADLPGSL